jgi:hypothetical protein
MALSGPTPWCATRSASDPKRTSGRPFLPSYAIEGSELFNRELDIDRGNIFLQMRNLRSARNGKHNRAALENPGESNLARSGARLGEATCSKREPGDEADAASLTIIEHVFTAGSTRL